MTHLLSQVIRSSLDEWVMELSHADYHNHKVELWTFHDQATRARAQAQLRQQGIEAFVYSAYKPLVHFCLENVALIDRSASRIEIRYPVHPEASEARFLLEAYPLGAMLRDKSVQFIADHTLMDHYQITEWDQDGEAQVYSVFAPNQLVQDATGSQQWSPCAWLRVTAPDGTLIQNEARCGDYWQVFNTIMQTVTQHEWPERAPYFERLEIDVQLPTNDDVLGYEHEVISLREALHEELYFSIQEWFKTREGKTTNARDAQPGQIVPKITRSTDEHSHIEVRLSPYVTDNLSRQSEPLATANHPLSIEQVTAELKALGGEPLYVATVTGREVTAAYLAGKEKAVVVSGGQHANETSGVVGALRAAQVLCQQDGVNLVVSPLENPDGYALHQEFIQSNPHHMHHAARYTALGDDLEYRSVEPIYEKGIRHQARQVSGAQLHINLHGYPSHEWTRPFSGYVPQGFEMWTIPKGFFLIIRHADTEQWQAYAEQFIEQVTLELQHCHAVMAMNRKQIALYEQHAGETGFRMINGYPCLISAVENPDFPLQLITEYPDETIYGEDFIAGHSIQMETVLAAYRVHQSLG